MKAMLFAAGKGTRLKPLTDNHPKCLVQAGGKTLLEHNLDFLKQAGVTSLIVNVHHHRQQVIDFIQSRDFGVEIKLSQESELLETGGGLLYSAAHFRDEPFFLACNSDIYTDLNVAEMIKTHTQNANLATLAVAERETSRYLRFDEQMHLCGWENRKTDETIFWSDQSYQTLAFNGIQVLSPEIFDYMNGLGTVFSTIPVYLKAAQAGAQIQAFRMDEAYWVDVGTVEKLEVLREHLQ